MIKTIDTQAVLDIYHRHNRDGYALAEEVLRLQAENERLRAALKKIEVLLPTGYATIVEITRALCQVGDVAAAALNNKGVSS